MTTDQARPVAWRRSARVSIGEGWLESLLLAGDAMATGLGAYIAPTLWASFDSNFAPHGDLRVPQVLFAIAWPISLRLFGMGGVATPRFGRRTIGAVGRATLLAVAVILLLFYLFPFLTPRGMTLLTVPLVAASTLIWRYGFLRFLQAQEVELRVAVIGTDEAARRTAAALAHGPGVVRYQLTAFLSPNGDTDTQILGAPVVELGDAPWTTLEHLGVDLIVVGHTRNLPPTVLAQLTRCFEYGVEAVPATVLYEQLTGRVLAGALEADWYAELPTYTRGMYTVVKRAVDLAVALLAGAAALVLAPLIAIAIFVDSGRPIILRQVRVGLRGEHFTLHKFRTMRVDAEKDGRPQWAQPNDARVTRVGHALRATRLDEVPQLWEVIRGKMSLIGPRPERPEFVDRLERELPLYRARSLVRPGITGWAQVQYPYAESMEKNLAKLEYDLYYIRHLGLPLDIAIMLRTLPVMIRPARQSESM